ncbi:MAG: ABC transporter ATP-binding protein [Candidatus Methylacidiphilales bacterium]
MNPNSQPLLSVEGLRIAFEKKGLPHEVVSGISFSIAPSETVAVVGESGSGKSVTALALTRLLPPPPTCQLEGSIRMGDRDILELRESELRKIRGKEIAYIFQEPSASLNPVLTIGQQIMEAIRIHRFEVREPDREAALLLDAVGIKDSKQTLRDYPHQLSGGMQQRAMIAMALACRPRLLVADEPTTALDVTIQAQIISLLRDLRSDYNMSILMITHNFGIVKGFADRVLVMFRGHIVEQGPTDEILNNPQHPYTRALIDCIPKLGKKQPRLTTIDYDAIERDTLPVSF